MILIDHYRPITSNWFFWVLTTMPTVLGMVLGIIVWSDMDLSLSPIGYETFLRTGALPIGLMGLAFPLGGIYGLVHKSKQLSQQILDEKLKRLYEKNMPTVDSIDAVLVHLYRLNNHSHVLNGWLVGRKRGNDQIARKLRIILEDWSSLYSEARFFPAMARIANLCEELDAVMCGYERCLTDHVIPGNLEFTGLMRDEHLAKFKELEQKVLDYRETIDAEYYEEANSLVRSFGLNGSKKIKSYKKRLQSDAQART